MRESDSGVALIVVLLIMSLLSALGLSLTMVTSTEELVADSYLTGSETFYAADAAFELAVRELDVLPDWSQVLNGSVRSAFIDRQSVSRGWPAGPARSSSEATALVTCRQAACTTAEMDARTSERPWGQNNPRWQLFAYGPMRDMAPSGTVESQAYVAVWVGDDPLENDGNPLMDGDEAGGPNPGRGVLTLLVHAYGTANRRVVEATIARGNGGVSVLSWREIR